MSREIFRRLNELWDGVEEIERDVDDLQYFFRETCRFYKVDTLESVLAEAGFYRCFGRSEFELEDDASLDAQADSVVDESERDYGGSQIGGCLIQLFDHFEEFALMFDSVEVHLTAQHPDLVRYGDVVATSYCRWFFKGISHLHDLLPLNHPNVMVPVFGSREEYRPSPKTVASCKWIFDERDTAEIFEQIRREISLALVNIPREEPVVETGRLTHALTGIGHSPDFRSIKWNGMQFRFTPIQAACVKVLWLAWSNGTPVLGQVEILEAAGSAGSRLRDVFNKGDHPAWGTLIVSAGKGAFRLADSTNRTLQ